MTETDLLSTLPPELRERARVLHAAAPAEGDYVLYWMHHAMRAHDNPALDTALALSAETGKPVLVYQGLGGAHRYDSDRHHLFILQGARDVSRALAERGIAYRFFLPCDGASSPLPDLVRRAAAVVFEMMPVAPFDRWQPRIAKTAAGPVVQVDARCIVPMPFPGKAIDRAFKFRDKLKHEYPKRIAEGWRDAAVPDSGALDASDWPTFDLADADDADLLAAIADLPINHAIGPVADTPGGSEAGYARWKTFRERGLRGYHRRRNDAAEQWPQGVSRMSAYLHYGMVSPFRLAADAMDTGGAGADKFIEELTVWREIAHNFCFHCSDPDAWSAIPAWARETLTQHSDDRRDRDLSLYALQHAQSDETLWDLAQRSLLAHGELHNNLRMTWAKVIPGWTRTPRDAHAALIDLNHRYALDGNDPSSYGGLLWALGLFDRPFTPEQPVLGTVRGRSVRQHADRLDLTAYADHVNRPQGRRLRVAVIGAGIAGIAAARTLADHNHEVVVIEKSRGPGGRAATRRRDAARFDHGAQFFTARDPRFAQHLASWEREGIIERWPAILGAPDGAAAPTRSTRWRGVGGMNALTRRMAHGLELITGTRVTALRRVDKAWELDCETTGPRRPGGLFDVVLVTAPAPQAAELLEPVQPDFAARARAIAFLPCWAAMFTGPAVPSDHWQAAFLNDNTLAWIGSRAADGEQRWVVHATSEWSKAHLEDDAELCAQALVNAFVRIAGVTVEADTAVAHRWRFARTEQGLDAGCLFDTENWIGVCGDWCSNNSRVESAWLSGKAAAGRVLAAAALTQPTAPVQGALL
ncbi:MAG: FAD-dependent oxidoreductase [Pseudomonadota bacterium]